MEFYKMQGLGNDFIIVAAAGWEEADSYQPLAAELCDRHFGVGADGLVVTGPDKDADLFMRIFNSDGSEPEMCGNAIRCIASLAWAKGWVARSAMAVRTLGGIKYPEIIPREDGSSWVRVDMGEPILERALIPMSGSGSTVQVTLNTSYGDMQATAVSMGNPHCILLVEDMETVPLTQWGPELECHPAFPAKTNVEFAQIIDRQTIRMRVWERGAGVTLACGTGSCATLVAAVLNQVSERAAEIRLDGGQLFIEWDEANNHVYMSGPAQLVFTGQLPVTASNI